MQIQLGIQSYEYYSLCILSFINLFCCISYKFSIVKCDAPRFCCKKTTKGCIGRCISSNWVNNGVDNCDSGLDEEGKFFK